MQKRFKLKRMFTTMFISYVTMLMIPAALAIGLTLTVNNMTVQQCINRTSNDIKQGQQLLETQLDIMDFKAMSLTYNYTLKWILELDGLSQGDKNVLTIHDFHESLKQIFLDSVGNNYYNVILKNDLVFTDRTVARGKEFFYQNYRKYEKMNYETYITNSFFAIDRCIFPLQKIIVNKEEVNALTYSYPVRSSINESNEADAVVQILIPLEKLEQYFQQILYLEQSNIYILDQQGNELALLSNGDVSNITLNVENMKHTTGSFTVKNKGQNTLVIYNKSHENNLIIAAAFPEAIVLKEARDLKIVFLIMMALSMLFELILGIIFARKYSTPIHNLMKNIRLMVESGKENIKEEANKSEYECFESSINKILQSNQNMQLTIKQKQEKERSDFLNYLFSGEFKENFDIIREGTLIGLELGKPFYCVASFQIEHKEKGIRWLLESDFENVIAIHEREKGYISVLLNVQGDECLKNVIKQMVNLSNNSDCNILKVGVGKVYENEKDISFSYMQSIYCITIQKCLDQTKMFFYDEVWQDFHALYYPTELEEKLMNSVKHGEISLIKEIFKEIRVENIEKRYLTQAMGRILASNITATLMKIYSDIIPDKQVDGLAETVLKQIDLVWALDILEEQLIKSCNELAKSKNKRKEDYQQRLVYFIEQNYSNPQLCVAMVAEEFTLSENYFSQFFKEVMDDSFSNYLETVRLNKAKQLIEENKFDLEKVAILVGYNNSSTFRRAFKRVTGVTPSMWKIK